MEQREQKTKALEEFGKFFPVNFYRNMTRKMNILTIVAPKQVREDGDFFKYLKLEHEVERVHNVLNTLHKQYENVKNKFEKITKIGHGNNVCKKSSNKKIKINTV